MPLLAADLGEKRGARQGDALHTPSLFKVGLLKRHPHPHSTHPALGTQMVFFTHALCKELREV